MNDDEIEPWVGTVWIFLGLLAVWSAIGCVALVVYWLGVFTAVIVNALIGWLA